MVMIWHENEGNGNYIFGESLEIIKVRVTFFSARLSSVLK